MTSGCIAWNYWHVSTDFLSGRKSGKGFYLQKAINEKSLSSFKNNGRWENTWMNMTKVGQKNS